MTELIEKFSLDGIHRSNAVFNFHESDPRHWTDDKAIWMNAEYIRTMPLADLLPFVKAEMKTAKLWRDEYEDDDKAWFEETIDLIRQRFFTLKDFVNQGRAYFSEDYDFDPAAIEKNLSKHPDLKTWLPELAERFEAEFDDSVSSPHVSKGTFHRGKHRAGGQSIHRRKGHQTRRHHERSKDLANRRSRRPIDAFGVRNSRERPVDTKTPQPNSLERRPPTTCIGIG